MVELATNIETLRKRVLRLLRLDGGKSDPGEVRTKILPLLENVGDVALIGGAIRDVARGGRQAFKSDLDFVVYGGSSARFHALMAAQNARPNRFGGFALTFSRWKVDVWHIEDTWARTSGLRHVDTIRDLLKCTFFDWDAVVFDVPSKRIFTDGDYLRLIDSRVMDLCLDENPNPTGSLVRALRRASQWNVYFGPKLTAFSERQLAMESWPALVELDKRAFAYPILHTLNYDRLLENLGIFRTVNDIRVTAPMGLRPEQLELALDVEATNEIELRLPA